MGFIALTAAIKSSYVSRRRISVAVVPSISTSAARGMELLALAIAGLIGRRVATLTAANTRAVAEPVTDLGCSLGRLGDASGDITYASLKADDFLGIIRAL